MRRDVIKDGYTNDQHNVTVMQILYLSLGIIDIISPVVCLLIEWYWKSQKSLCLNIDYNKSQHQPNKQYRN